MEIQKSKRALSPPPQSWLHASQYYTAELCTGDMFTTVEQQETPVDSGVENKKQRSVVDQGKQQRVAYAEDGLYFFPKPCFSEKTGLDFLMQLFSPELMLFICLLYLYGFPIPWQLLRIKRKKC